jgi:cytidylate kinase
MSLAEFGLYATDNPEVDVELDARLAELAQAGDVLVESRLAGWIARNEGLAAVTVFVDADPRVRAERVAAREGLTVERALADNAERERVERARYFALYGIDIEDTSIYDLVLDSASLSPPELADRVAAAVPARFPRRAV